MQHDSLHRFLIENTNVRGEWVHLDNTWQQLLACADYPAPVKKVLGEALAATMLLSATLKYKGMLSLQINGQGAINLLLIQATSEGTVRGLARYKQEPVGDSLQELFGDGHLVITIEPSDGGERYQGVVSLQEDTLANALAAYFEQSEQLKTRLWLAADDKVSTGMLLQRLPNADSDNQEGWDHTVHLSETLTSEELLSLDKDVLLHRLFHAEDIRLFEGEPLKFQCGCSQEKIEGMINSLGKQEAESMIAEQGKIQVDCEFCNHRYQLDHIDVQRIFADNIVDGGDTVH